MLVACRLAGLSALETYYAGGRARAQFGADANPHCGLVPRQAPEPRAYRAPDGRRSCDIPQGPSGGLTDARQSVDARMVRVGSPSRRSRRSAPRSRSAPWATRTVSQRLDDPALIHPAMRTTRHHPLKLGLQCCQASDAVFHFDQPSAGDVIGHRT